MFDLIVIGSGPAGYVAAERAGEHGLKTMLVEQGEHLGGVCLNCGCIPTKSMLYSAKVFHHAKHAAPFGVKVAGVEFDYPAVKQRTEGIQNKLRGGIAALMKMNKIEVIKGSAQLTGKNSVSVNGQSYEAKNILICTGSRAFVPPIPGLKDNPNCVTNEGILAQKEMVSRLCVIGGGVIGIEFASLYATAGRSVTVIEMLPQICGNTDKELALTVQKELQNRGVTFHINAKVTGVNGATVSFTDAKGQEQKVEADLVLVATGRAVNTESLALDKAGVDFDRKGIKVDECGRTNVPGIWAAGDVTGRWQLAHYASRQATVAVNNIAGHPDRCREEAIPAVVYTEPEIASVGLTEDQAKAKGLAVKTAKFNLGANGRYLAETDGGRGVFKLVVGAERGEILGAHLVGPGVSEMIAAAAVMIEAELRVGDLREVVFPHPTIGEALHDAAYMFK